MATIRAYYAGMFLYWGALYVYSPILSVYAQSLGVSFTTVGMVVGAYGFVQMWLRISLGIWSDRLGRRLPFLYAGHFFNLVGCLGLAMAPTPMYLVAFRGVLGISAATWVAFTVLFASYFPPNQSPKAMGVVTAINGVSLIIVNGLGGQIAQMWGMGATFYAGAGLAAIGLITTVPIKEHRATRHAPTFRQIWRIITHPALMLIASITALNHYSFWATTLVLGVFLSGCSGLLGKEADPMPRASTEFTFDQYEVVIGSAKRQTVLSGFLLGGDIAELVVVSIDDNDDRRLHIYAFDDGSWVLRLDATLRPEVLFVDVANIGGRDRLITYEPGRLNWFDLETATETELVAVTSNFNPPRSGEIPHVDITRDLNGDDCDDLVVPDIDGFRVFIQRSDGTFADPVKVGPPAEMGRIYGADGYRYNPWSQSRVHEIDYNRDGRNDLVFWNEDHFLVHRQDERGLFSPAGESFTIDVAFDSDEFSSLATGDMLGKVLHSLSDLNGDSVADLVVFSLEGRSVSNKRSAYEVHFGTPAPDGGTEFAPEVSAAFRSDDCVQLGMYRHDFDHDGQVDLMLTTIGLEFLKSSLWKRLKGFMGDDIWLDLEFYHMDGGFYVDNPNITRRIALDGAPSHREPGWVPLDIVLRGGTHESRSTQKSYLRAFNRTMLIGDVTGDGRSDLLIEWTHMQLCVYVGVPGPELFARRPQKVAVALPNDGEYTWLVDINKDGVQDILMHHPFTLRDAHGAPKRSPGTEPHRVTMLIAR